MVPTTCRLPTKLKTVRVDAKGVFHYHWQYSGCLLPQLVRLSFRRARKREKGVAELSPFACELLELRKRLGLLQGDFAELIGCHQSYISALEGGIKGPPESEFIEKLVAVSGLTDSEAERVRKAADASVRALEIPRDTPEDTYWMLAELREALPTPHPAQVRMIQDLLEIPPGQKQPIAETPQRTKRRTVRDHLDPSSQTPAQELNVAKKSSKATLWAGFKCSRFLAEIFTPLVIGARSLHCL